MSLGGYKFAGYKCTKASGMSDVDLSLLIHKTRLKAFTEACSKAGANWHFCKNSGTHDFEGNTGVIYNIIGVTVDFVSFFQYENENKYFAIITCPEISDGIFHNESRGLGYYVNGGDRFLWTYRTMFHCASIVSLDADFFIKQDSGGVASYPTGALPLMPISPCYLTTSSNITNISSGGKWFIYPHDGLYALFGYAVKDSKIITFATQSHSGNNYIATGQFFINVIGFDAMQLSSQSDRYNLFHASLNITNTEVNECYIPVQKNAVYGINNCVQVLNSSGRMYANSGYSSSCIISTTTQAGFVYGISSDIPFSAVYITTQESQGQNWSVRSNVSGTLLNEDGIFSKGMVDIDLIASNVTNGYSNLNSCKPYANGNYLLGCKDYGGNVQYYVGWDASNPDITLDASWTEYTDM